MEIFPRLPSYYSWFFGPPRREIIGGRLGHGHRRTVWDLENERLPASVRIEAVIRSIEIEKRSGSHWFSDSSEEFTIQYWQGNQWKEYALRTVLKRRIPQECLASFFVGSGDGSGDESGVGPGDRFGSERMFWDPQVEAVELSSERMTLASESCV